jgi:hypothetical protein
MIDADTQRLLVYRDTARHTLLAKPDAWI